MTEGRPRVRENDVDPEVSATLVAECIEIISTWPGKSDSEKAVLIEKAKGASVAELRRCRKWKCE